MMPMQHMGGSVMEGGMTRDMRGCGVNFFKWLAILRLIKLNIHKENSNSNEYQCHDQCHDQCHNKCHEECLCVY